MKLTKVQIDHIRSRLSRAAEVKKSAAKQLLGAKPSMPDFEAKIAEIRAGRAVLLPDSKLTNYTDVDDAFTYPVLDRRAKQDKAAVDAYDRKVASIDAKFDANVESIMDTVLLGGDADEALRLVESFVAG